MESEELEKAIEILQDFKNGVMARDKLEWNVRNGGYKIGEIYKLLTLNPAIETVLQALENSISKDKIREKIEELDKEYNRILSDYGNIDTDITFNIPNENVRKYLDKLVIEIVILQELLEE